MGIIILISWHGAKHLIKLVHEARTNPIAYSVLMLELPIPKLEPRLNTGLRLPKKEQHGTPLTLLKVLPLLLPQEKMPLQTGNQTLEKLEQNAQAQTNVLEQANVVVLSKGLEILMLPEGATQKLLQNSLIDSEMSGVIPARLKRSWPQLRLS